MSFFRFVCFHYSLSANYLSRSFVNVMLPSFHAGVQDSLTVGDDRREFDHFSKSNNSRRITPPTDFFYCNVRSLVPKSHVLLNYASLYNPSVFALTETWLNESYPSSLICPPHYIPFREDRRGTRGGGALILVKDVICASRLNVYSDDSLHRIDAVACQLCFGRGHDLGVLCLYRPPDCSSSDILLLFDIIDNFLKHELKYFLILGDFNFPDIVWPYSAVSLHSNMFLKFCQENFLTQHVHSATRKISNSLLDLVFTSQGTTISSISVNEEFGSSDHRIIQFSVCVKQPLSVRKSVKRNL